MSTFRLPRLTLVWARDFESVGGSFVVKRLSSIRRPFRCRRSNRSASLLIKDALRHHDEDRDIGIVVPLELLEQAKNTRLMFMVFMGVIAGVSLLVGGIGIMNIMLATVTGVHVKSVFVAPLVLASLPSSANSSRDYYSLYRRWPRWYCCGIPRPHDSHLGTSNSLQILSRPNVRASS